MNKTVVIVNGSGGVGKDTFIDLVISSAEKYYSSQISSSEIVNLSTITRAKQLASLCGWNGEKSPKDRKFLSDIKDLLTEWADIPFKDVSDEINRSSAKIFFVHCREAQEIDKFVEAHDAITILIKNENVDKVESNHADANVENYHYNYLVNNSGTLDDLEELAKSFLYFLIN